MASAVGRPMGEAPAFSYAQAAKGRTASVAPTSTTQSSQAASGTNTPSRDSASAVNVSLNPSNATGGSEVSKATPGGIADSNGAKIARPESDSGSKSGNALAPSSPSSPSIGTDSTSTLPKEEEISLTSTGAADRGTWRQQGASSANTSDRYVEAPEGRRGGKGKKDRGQNARYKDSDKKEVEKEKEPGKSEAPLVAAPPPAVNIWAQRKEKLAKAKPAVVQVPAKVETPIVNGVLSAAKQSSEQKRRPKVDENEKQSQTGAPKEPAKTQKKNGDVRREEQAGKRAAPRGSRVGEKDEKPQLPPVDDAASWPTPDTAVEEHRKVSEKTIKEDEKEETSNKEKKPKESWTKLDFTPTAIFQTMPTRGRGNRGGARGGRDASGRAGHLANGSAGGDKASSSTVPYAEGKEQRGRDNASAGRAASLPPQNSKRAPSDDPHASHDHRKQSIAHDKAKINGGPQSAKTEQSPFGFDSRRASLAPVSGAGAEFHPGAEFHRQARADYPQSVSQADGYGGHRSESNGRSVDGYNGGVNYTQHRGAGSERGRYRSGRGNQSNFVNGHMPGGYPNTQGLPNGFLPRQGPYSPPLNGAQYGPAYSSASRGRGGGRGSSMSGFGGRFNGANGQHMSPIQTSGPMFAHPSMGMDIMSAPPFNLYVDQINLVSLVKTQLEYYFSVDNLCKDIYLRKHMDSQGFVHLTFIAGFTRMQKLTPDRAIIKFAAEGSEVIEIATGSDMIDRMRARHSWEKWVMPMEQRDDSAKNSGPEKFVHSQTQSQPYSAQLPPTASTFSPNGTDFQPYSMLPPALANGVTQKQETPLSGAVPHFTPSFSSNACEDENKSFEAENIFHNDRIKHLYIVYRNLGHDEHSFRTFPNGSITEESNQHGRQGQSRVNGTSDNTFVILLVTEKNGSGDAPTVLWTKYPKKDGSVMSNQNQTDSYSTFRATALNHRETSLVGQPNYDMNALYEFWSHFLIHNFNATMYEEFHRLALEDAYQRKTTVGISNLINYYDEVLKRENVVIPATLAQHYVQLVKQESGNEERPGFAKLRAAWRNGATNMKSRKRIDTLLDAQLREELSR